MNQHPKPTNYLKLSARRVERIDDPDAVPAPPLDFEGEPRLRLRLLDKDRLYVTTWVYPFRDAVVCTARAALAAAQAKRAEIQASYPDAEVRLSVHRPSVLRGVPTIGRTSWDDGSAVEIDEADAVRYTLTEAGAAALKASAS